MYGYEMFEDIVAAGMKKNSVNDFPVRGVLERAWRDDVITFKGSKKIDENHIVHRYVDDAGREVIVTEVIRNKLIMEWDGKKFVEIIKKRYN